MLGHLSFVIYPTTDRSQTAQATEHARSMGSLADFRISPPRYLDDVRAGLRRLQGRVAGRSLAEVWAMLAGL